MRGKPVRRHFDAAKNRIIPAHAGQTRARLQAGPGDPDHPRACGANPTWRRARSTRSGSSPRMRGKPRTFPDSTPVPRIIPAHAGQTWWINVYLLVNPDHPRACGANWKKYSVTGAVSGSSPRMRGKPGHFLRLFQHGRIIPAHAGQTA